MVLLLTVVEVTDVVVLLTVVVEIVIDVDVSELVVVVMDVSVVLVNDVVVLDMLVVVNDTVVVVEVVVEVVVVDVNVDVVGFTSLTGHGADAPFPSTVCATSANPTSASKLLSSFFWLFMMMERLPELPVGDGKYAFVTPLYNAFPVCPISSI